MTIGGVFKLFGYSLDSMRKVEFLLNGERTRLVESYPFNRDRAARFSGTLLGEYGSFQRNAFLSELVVGWQQGVPIRALHGPHWQKKGFLYAQLGTSDTLALPRIPPSSYIAIRPIDEKERQNPDPERISLPPTRQRVLLLRLRSSPRQAHTPCPRPHLYWPSRIPLSRRRFASWAGSCSSQFACRLSSQPMTCLSAHINLRL